jgi:hypothetical protein
MFSLFYRFGRVNNTNNPSITSTNAQKIITIPKLNVEPIVAPACSYSF